MGAIVSPLFTTLPSQQLTDILLNHAVEPIQFDTGLQYLNMLMDRCVLSAHAGGSESIDWHSAS
jgi:hypothetical protein